VEEGLGAVMQQELMRHNDTCHIVLTAVHAKVTEGFAAKEAALREAHMSASTAQAASKPAFSVSMGSFCHPCSSTNQRLCCTISLSRLWHSSLCFLEGQE